MKKIVAVAIGMAMIAGAAYAQTPTYSQNAVGFINVDMQSGNLYALSLPFVQVGSYDSTFVFTNTPLAEAAPNGSSVYFWDVEKQTWTTVNKTRNKFNTDKVLGEGEFFFFKPNTNMTAVLSGQVPAYEDSEITVFGEGALSAIAYAYPVDMPFTNTTLAAEAPNGSSVYFWDVEKQTWVTVNKTRNKFNTDRSIEPGRGIFFKNTTNNITWKEEKGYAFP